MKQLRWKAAAVRGGRFYVVGALGMVVQLSLLAILLHGCHLGCIAATAVAVELTVLHNFFWHERFTWADRPTGASRDMCVRLIRFNLSTGAVSVAGNLLFTDFLVGQIGWPPLMAGFVSIGGCSLFNFWVSDHWVFRLAE
jgi:putative flippase GtrA